MRQAFNVACLKDGGKLYKFRRRNYCLDFALHKRTNSHAVEKGMCNLLEEIKEFE